MTFKAAFTTCSAAFCLALMPKIVFGQTEKDDSYDRAIRALNANDCKTAIVELNHFKSEAQSQLQQNPSFASQVEEQIRLCRDRNNVGAASGSVTTSHPPSATPQ